MPIFNKDPTRLKRTRVPFRIMEVKPRKDTERVVTRKTPPYSTPSQISEAVGLSSHVMRARQIHLFLGLVFDLEHSVLVSGVHEIHLVFYISARSPREGNVIPLKRAADWL